MRVSTITIVTLAASLVSADAMQPAVAAPAPVVRGVVWSDVDRDGVRDRGEPGVAGVVVTLERRAGRRWTAVRSAKTSASGRYQLRRTGRGQLRLRMSAPAGRAFSPQRQGPRRALDSDVSASGVVALRRGSAVIDAGLLPAPAPLAQPVVPPAPTPAPGPSGTPTPPLPGPGGTVTGTAWREITIDGRRAAGEPASMPATVQLWDEPRSQVLATTTSATDGSYSLALPTAGVRYRVRVALPGGAAGYTQPDVAGDDVDSDVIDAGAEAGYSPAFTAMGDARTIDAGLRFFPPVSLSGRVWRDADNDGVEEQMEEPGYAEFELWTADRTVRLATFTTSLDPATRGLWSITAPFGGIDVRVRRLGNGSEPVGKFRAASVTADSDFIQWGADDGWTPPLTLSTVGAPTTDIGLGLVYAVQLGSLVWRDTDADGRQDPGESGREGVTVELWTSDRQTLLASDVTDANGRYNLPARGSGSHHVRVVPPVSNQLYSPQNATGCAAAAGVADDDECDSDVNGDGWMVVTTTSNQITAPMWDAGLRPTLILSP